MDNLLYSLLILFAQSVAILLIFQSLIKKNISLIYILIFPLVMLLAHSVLNYFFFITSIIYLFFLGSKITKNINHTIMFFYSIYTIFLSSLLSYFVIQLIGQMISKNTFNTYAFLLNISLIPFFPVIINSLFIKLLKPNFDYLRKHGNEIDHSFLVAIDIILTICCTIQFSSYWIEKYLFNGENPLRNWMIATFLITIVVLLRYIGNKTKELDRQRIQELKDNQLTDLTAYVHQVESMYDELRSFRHDYHNVLISLNESIKTKNLSIIEKTYDQILNNEGLKLQETQYSLAKLNNLKTLPVKGVFSTHVITAWQKKIDVHLEIEDVIENEPIDVLDYVRITSILLDNAIEAAEKAEKPSLNIVCFTIVNSSEIYLIIENSCENEQLNIAKIFQSGVSTKGENRGVGLANVNKILKEYPHISLQTESEPFLFRQTLIINKEEQP